MHAATNRGIQINTVVAIHSLNLPWESPIIHEIIVHMQSQSTIIPVIPIILQISTSTILSERTGGTPSNGMAPLMVSKWLSNSCRSRSSFISFCSNPSVMSCLFSELVFYLPLLCSSATVDGKLTALLPLPISFLSPPIHCGV